MKNYKKLIIEECLSRVDEATDWIYEYNHKKVEDYVMFHLGEKEITQ